MTVEHQIAKGNWSVNSLPQPYFGAAAATTCTVLVICQNLQVTRIVVAAAAIHD